MISKVEFEQRIILENYIWSCIDSPTSIDFNSIDPLWFQKFINYVSFKKFLNFPFLSKCISKICLKDLIFDLSNSNFNKYLYVKGIIQQDQCRAKYKSPKQWRLEDIDYYEEPIKKDSLQFYIKEDDISNFLFYTINNNISITNELFCIFDQFFSITNFACLEGSINIIKYLYSNNISIDNKSLGFAVSSGNESLIDFLSNLNYSFDNKINDAIQYHHVEIAKWVYNNYVNDHFTLSDCVEAFNSELFLYFLEEIGLDINAPSFIMKNTSLINAVINNDLLLARFITSNFKCINSKNSVNKYAMNYCQTKEMESIIDNAFCQ